MAISTFNRKKQFFAAEVEGLIKQLTGFEEDDKNYLEVERFIFSNIIHHNFATVDITNVKRTIDGYVVKFKAHGLNKRARRFRKLVDKYLSSDTSQHTQLNVQWHVLWLLLNLSCNPTKVSEESLRVLEVQHDSNKAEEEVNWTEYLLEGVEDFYCSPETDEDEESYWALSEAKEEIEQQSVISQEKNLPTQEEKPSFGNIPHPSLWCQPPAPSRQDSLRRIVREGAQAEQWLRQNVQHSWWHDSSYRSAPCSKYSEAHTCEIWEKAQDHSLVNNSSSVTPQLSVLSEFKVIQELLWILQVPAESAVFTLNDNDLFYVNPSISLPSTAPDTLNSYLGKLCPYVNIVNTLKKFEDTVNEHEMSENPPPVTYKAYSAALSKQLQKFNKIVVSIEMRLAKQEETMTLLSVIDELIPGLDILQYLHDIHEKAIMDWISHPAWLCATRLLSVLYEAVRGASDEKFLEVSLAIFIHSFHPYLDIIDIWLSEGRLENWRREFLVIREEDGGLQVMPYDEEMYKCDVQPVSLLTRLVAVVSEAGQTMELVSALNKLQEFRDTVHNKGCLYKEFSENVYNEIKRLKETIAFETINDEIQMDKELVKNKKDDETEDKEEKITSDLKEYVNEEASNHERRKEENGTFIETGGEPIVEGDIPLYMIELSSKDMYDQTMAEMLDNTLLKEVFSNYICSYSPQQNRSIGTTSMGLVSDSCSASLVGLMSIHSVLEKQLELVEMRQKIASCLVTQTLRTEHNLLQHFTVLRTVFFMENGNLAQSFYSYLFKEIEAGTWNNVMSLNEKLKVCLEEFFPEFENYFTVQIESSSTVAHRVYHVIPLITLVYRVEWPISLVITESSIESYNKVFKFLLHLKYAFWTLNNIYFSDLADSRNTLLVRRLHLLKIWMLHSTSTLHSYFMGLVLRSYSTHLEESIQLADSLHVIVQAHERFLDEVKVHCLQDKKNYLEGFIKKLLKLCSALSDLWDMEATGVMSETDLENVEREFLLAYHNLIYCLEMVSPEEDVNNILYELKCEIAASEPVHISFEYS